MPGSRRLFACALASASLAACEDPIEPFTGFDEPRVLVHSVLDAVADTQKVLIEMTNFGGAVTGIVTVTASTGDVIPLRLRGMRPGDDVAVYFFTAMDHVIQPGGTYHLQINRGGRTETITGSTTVPAYNPGPPAADLLAEDVFDPDEDTLRLSWARVPGARGYEVLFSYDNPFAPGSFDRISIFADTSIALAGNARSLDGEELFRRGQAVEVIVIAVDDNYYTYYRAGADPFAGAPPSRLTGGALGVFGSIAPVMIRSFQIE